MAEDVNHFIPPDIGEASVLARYLTPLPANACDAFIRAYVPPGGVVWDPFCRTDTVGRIAARQGKRAILSDFNPLVVFTIRATLRHLTPREFDRAVTALATSPKQQTTLETHITSLYSGPCSFCGTPIVVSRYVWGQSQDANQPDVLIEKEYHCPTCNQDHSTPVGDADRAVLSQIEERGRLYWTLLERLGAAEAPLRPLAERLLARYTPRTLYALATIQTKIEAVITDRAAADVLALALLDTLDQCMKRPPTDERSQTAKRDAEGTYVELNSWQVFTEACRKQRRRLERSAADAPRLPSGSADALRPPAFVAYPIALSKEAQASESPVLVRRASARRAAEDIAEGSVHLVVAAPPAVDWGDMLPLSYLWSGWLLGKDEAQVFSADYLLRPKRPNDWPWLFSAIERSCRAILRALAEKGTVILCLPLTNLTYLNVLILAATAAGLHLQHIAYQPYNEEHLQRPPAVGAVSGYCYLRFSRLELATPAAPLTDDVLADARREALAAASDILHQRAEPAAYVWLHLAMLVRLAQTGLLARIARSPNQPLPPWETLRQVVQGALEQDSGHTVRLLTPAGSDAALPQSQTTGDETTEQSLSQRRGIWWLSSAEHHGQPLSDRIEWAVYTVLSTTTLATDAGVGRVIHALFPGLLTPDPGWIELYLQSYAKRVPPNQWQLRPEDDLKRRTQEHTDLVALLTDLGHRLGFRVWVGLPERRHQSQGIALADRLSALERYVNVEELIPDATEHSRLIDVVWYQNWRATHIFEVEWTAMLSESVLTRASRAAGIARFLVVPAERAALIEAKQSRLPLLRRRLADDGWWFMRFDALRTFAADESQTVADLPRLAGLQPPAPDQGVQLKLL